MTPPAPSAGPTGETPTPPPAHADGPAEQVRRLLAAGKCKQAVELAKDEHKLRPTPQSEQLLVDAYVCRIEQFEDKGAFEDARVLLKVVADRFPAHRGRFAVPAARAAAAEGKVADLVAPLADPNVTADARAAIEAAVRRELVDLAGLVGTSALPPGHPLKAGAAAVWRAFQAVTAGPVTDEQIALPEISHRSPLAGWKLLVRALAAFYRDDDAGCRRALEGIGTDTAVRRLVPVVTALAEHKALPPGPAGALQAKVAPGDRPLKEAVANFEKALTANSTSRLKRAIRDACAACRASHPDRYERLRQHISVRCVMEGVPAADVLDAMGPARRDAYFWRLLARGMEQRANPEMAAVNWERFARHAVHEKQFAANSPEAAMVYLQAAGLVARLPAAELAFVRNQRHGRSVLVEMYKGQPPEVAALAPKSDADVFRRALDPGWLFRQSAEIYPDAETFRQWHAWAQDANLQPKEVEDIAKFWRQKVPRDVKAPLLLSTLAEQRNALKLALTHLADAEAIDALHPAVRKARLRLTLSTAWRHFKARKPHLVEQDLAELAAVPAMAEGDRPALLTAMRAAWHAVRGDKPAADREYADLAGRVGPLAATALLDSIEYTARLGDVGGWPGDHPEPTAADPDPRAVAEAEARLMVLGTDLNLHILRPRAWSPLVNEVLRQVPCPLPPAGVSAIGRAAAGRGDREQAYLASAALLDFGEFSRAAAASGPAAARALLLRAKSLPAWAHARVTQCLRAAADLARQAHDPDLIAEVSAEVDHDPRTQRAMARGRGLGDEVLADVLKAEREARAFPKGPADADRHVVAVANEAGPGGAFEDGADQDDEAGGGPFDEDYDDEDDNGPFPRGIPGLPKGLPRSAMPVVAELIEQYGRLPSPEELMQTDPAMAVRLMMTVEGINIDLNPGMLNELLNELGRRPPGFGGGGGGRRKKKRRR